MKKILISIAAVSALGAAILPAVASAQSINDRQAMLDRRFDRISAQIRYERHDRDYGAGYGDHRGPGRW